MAKSDGSGESLMPTIEVDLRTRILPPDHQVLIARPGKEYRLYPFFTENHVIGPELPGLDLTAGVPLPPDIDNRIKRSVRLRNWHERNRPMDHIPPRNLQSYEGAYDQNRLGQYRGIVTGYFERAKKGDVVIISPKSFEQDAIIGELLGDPTEFESIRLQKFEGDPLTVRRYRQLARVPKSKLNTRILNIIGKPNMLVLLEKQFRREIYSLAYGNFALQDDFNTRFEVGSDDFNTDDDFLIKLFIRFVTNNTIKTTINGEDEVDSIVKSAFNYAGDLAPELQMNINSPGFIGLSSKYIIPAVISVMFALAVTIGPEVAQAALDGHVLIGNSAAPHGDLCTAEVAEAALKQIKLLGLDKWAEACEYARKVAQHADVTTSATVVRKP
jgi:hypothetical protein